MGNCMDPPEAKVWEDTPPQTTQAMAAESVTEAIFYGVDINPYDREACHTGSQRVDDGGNKLNISTWMMNQCATTAMTNTQDNHPRTTWELPSAHPMVVDKNDLIHGNQCHHQL